MIASLGLLVVMVSPGDDLPAALQSDAAFTRYHWVAKASSTHAPFVFVVGDVEPVNDDEAAEIESSYGPPLAALRESWRTEWVEPLGIDKLPPDLTIPIVMVPDWDQYRTIFWNKQGNDQSVPAAFTIDGAIVTYFHRQKYQSTLARRKAILDAAAVELLLRTAASARDKISAWLVTGLAAQLSDGEGGEIPMWRQDLAGVKSLLEDAPTFEAAFKCGSMHDVEAAATGDRGFYYRSYLRLFGYSLLTFVRSAPGARHERGFVKYVRDEFKGKGGWQEFLTSCQEGNTLVKDWYAFAGLEMPESVASSTPRAGTPRRPTRMPFEVLDFTPSSTTELRAEVIRRVRSGAFAEAQSLLLDETVVKVASRDELTRDRRLLENCVQLYMRFARSLKTGDSLPTGVGLTGKVTKLTERTFDLEVKKLVVTHPWTDLMLLGVARRVFPDLQFDDATEATQAIQACVLAGDKKQARTFLGQLGAKGIKTADVSALEGLMREFDPALEEADAREAIDEALKKEAAFVLTPILKLARTPSIAKTAAFARAKPFLRRLAAEVETRKFRLTDVFRGKISVSKDNAVTLQYALAKQDELGDWQLDAHSRSVPSLDAMRKVLGLASAPAAASHCEADGLLLTPGTLLIHCATWVGDVTVELNATQLAACDESRERKACQFFAGWCAPAAGRWFAVRHFSEAVSDAAGALRSLSTPLAWLANTDYRVSIMRRGSKWSVLRSGQETGTLDESFDPVSPFVACLGTSTYRIKELTITGRLDPLWAYQARQTKVDELMKGIFGE